MRKRQWKKVLAVCLMLCLSVGAAPTAFAMPSNETEAVMPYYLYIQNNSCSLGISGTTATVQARITGQSSVTSKCRVVATLQRQTASGSWVAVQAWSKDSSTYNASLYETISVTSGTTYRVKAVLTVWSGSESESVTIYSDTKTA